MNKEIFPDDQIPQDDEFFSDVFENRRDDRRKEPSEGYAYVSMVGWFDRREQIRRKDDNYPY